MSWTLSAAFDNSEQATFAVRELRQAAGIGDIQIRTPYPLSGLPTGIGSSRIPLFSFLGALLGGVAGFLMATMTALSFPIPTGGMPIVAWGPVGIVTYEATMLGAILATFAGFLYELRLPKLGPIPYDDTHPGSALRLTVHCDTKDQLDLARGILEDAEAKGIKSH
jgi:hypothetical protein